MQNSAFSDRAGRTSHELRLWIFVNAGYDVEIFLLIQTGLVDKGSHSNKYG